MVLIRMGPTTTRIDSFSPLAHPPWAETIALEYKLLRFLEPLGWGGHCARELMDRAILEDLSLEDGSAQDEDGTGDVMGTRPLIATRNGLVSRILCSYSLHPWQW